MNQYAVFGHPIAHSLSPRIHKLFGVQAGLALSYVALSVLVLALFAVPLWYAWSVNLATFREYVHAEDVRRLTEVLGRQGASELAAQVDSLAASYPRDQVILLADSARSKLAGSSALQRHSAGSGLGARTLRVARRLSRLVAGSALSAGA